MVGSGIVPVTMCFMVIPCVILPPLPVRVMIMMVNVSLTKYALGSSPALGTVQGTGGFVVHTVGLLFTNVIFIQNNK